MRKSIRKILALGMMMALTTSSPIYAGYNGQDAADYAFTHYKNTSNGDYYYFSGGNCTNFVSQSIKAGGINVRDTGNPQGFYLKIYMPYVLDREDEFGNYWYMRKVSTATGKVYWYTETWSVVEAFRNYHKKNKGTVIQYSQTADSLRALCNQLKVGDVLQNGNKHSIIITALNDKTEKTIRFCGQTNESHKKLEEFFAYAAETTPGQKINRITFK